MQYNVRSVFQILVRYCVQYHWHDTLQDLTRIFYLGCVNEVSVVTGISAGYSTVVERRVVLRMCECGHSSKCVLYCGSTH